MTEPSKLEEGEGLGPGIVGGVQVSFLKEYGQLNLIISVIGAPPEAQIPLDLTALPGAADSLWQQLRDQAKGIAENGWRD